jgi:hypothetical protein
VLVQANHGRRPRLPIDGVPVGSCRTSRNCPDRPERPRRHALLRRIEATEEAIVNALVAAETMRGRSGAVVHALHHDMLRDVMRRYGR